MNCSCDVVIVGAGPYGLSVAAHLRSRGISFRIFGSPMSTWRDHMPKGMFLKSDGFASNLSDPQSDFTLKHFCDERSIPYHDYRIPVALDTFTAYGHKFQTRFVPELEDKQVVAVDKTPDGFNIRVDTGETVSARRVILAVGITHFQYIPPDLEGLPPDLLTHSFAHREIEHFIGKEITIIGAGASAMDLAAILHESGVGVTVVSRSPNVFFHNPPEPEPRSLWKRIRYPRSGIGPGLQSRFFASAPRLFHYFPRNTRVAIVRRHLGPAASWTVRERVLGRMPLLLGHRTQKAEARDGKVHLSLVDDKGVEKKHVTEHVIAATGYQVDLRRLSFLSERLRSQVLSFHHSPVLSSNFQSTVPGLYFVGVAAANSFGPVLRFAFGADFAARHIAKHLVRPSSAKMAAA